MEKKKLNFEHEILDQLLDNDWPLKRNFDFLLKFGAVAWTIITHYLKEENLVLLDLNGNPFPDWKVQEILRSNRIDDEILVQCTSKGAKLVT